MGLLPRVIFEINSSETGGLLYLDILPRSTIIGPCRSSRHVEGKLANAVDMERENMLVSEPFMTQLESVNFLFYSLYHATGLLYMMNLSICSTLASHRFECCPLPLFHSQHDRDLSCMQRK